MIDCWPADAIILTLSVETIKKRKGGNHSEPIFGKVWFALFDFEPIPRSQQAECKGFQGFRYFFDNQTKFTSHARLFL